VKIKGLNSVLNSTCLNPSLGSLPNFPIGPRRENIRTFGPIERVWLRERKATALSRRDGFNILRRGFSKLD
jgi:hypothetical protein